MASPRQFLASLLYFNLTPRISENATLPPLRRVYSLQSGEAEVCADDSPKKWDASWGKPPASRRRKFV